MEPAIVPRRWRKAELKLAIEEGYGRVKREQRLQDVCEFSRDN